MNEKYKLGKPHVEVKNQMDSITNRQRTAIVALVIGVLALIIMLDTAYGDEGNPLVDAFHVFAEGQLEMIQQNNVLISQNYEIIELLMGNKNIFVAGVTDRYDILEYSTASTCTFYDRLEVEIKTETCPITGLTKDAFNAMITNSPQR